MKYEKSKIRETQEGSSICRYYYFMDCDGMAALSAHKSWFCRYGKCKGISIPVSHRDIHYDYIFWENYIRSLLSPDNFKTNTCSKHSIFYDLFISPGRRDYFYDDENHSAIFEKSKKRIYFLIRGHNTNFINSLNSLNF